MTHPPRGFVASSGKTGDGEGGEMPVERSAQYGHFSWQDFSGMLHFSDTGLFFYKI